MRMRRLLCTLVQYMHINIRTHTHVDKNLHTNKYTEPTHRHTDTHTHTQHNTIHTIQMYIHTVIEITMRASRSIQAGKRLILTKWRHQNSSRAYNRKDRFPGGSRRCDWRPFRTCQCIRHVFYLVLEGCCNYVSSDHSRVQTLFLICCRKVGATLAVIIRVWAHIFRCMCILVCSYTYKQKLLAWNPCPCLIYVCIPNHTT